MKRHNTFFVVVLVLLSALTVAGPLLAVAYFYSTNEPPRIEILTTENGMIGSGDSTNVIALVSDETPTSVDYRWEA